MTERDIFQDAARILKEESAQTPLEALIKGAEIPVTLGQIVTIFENRLARILDARITGLDHEGQRVPLYFGKSPHAHQFYISTSPESDPRTPQNRVEYTLKLASDGTLTAYYTHTKGMEIVDQGIRGEEKFSNMCDEFLDLLASVLRHINWTFSPEERPGIDQNAAAGTTPRTFDHS